MRCNLFECWRIKLKLNKMKKIVRFVILLVSFAIILHFMEIIDLRKIINRIKSFNYIYKSELPRQEKANKIDAFLSLMDAPVAGYGMDFVLVAEKYNLDWRLLPAICLLESAGGKFPYRNDPENVMGYIVDRDIVSISEAINLSAKSLSGNGRTTHRLYKNKSTRQKLYIYSGGEPNYHNKIFSLMEKIYDDGKPIV